MEKTCIRCDAPATRLVYSEKEIIYFLCQKCVDWEIFCQLHDLTCLPVRDDWDIHKLIDQAERAPIRSKAKQLNLF